MRVQVRKWGNSLALRIPNSFASEAALSLGAYVDLTIQDGRLVVTPVAKPKYALQDLLARVTPENLHGELDAGPGVGAEAPAW
jgi:antitoxin MazE